MRLPKEGDIWLVHYPYSTPGNMEKIRPAIIKSINNNDTVTVQKLSTKYHKGSKVFTHNKLKRKTFLSKEIISIKDYNLVRYIGKKEERKERN